MGESVLSKLQTIVKEGLDSSSLSKEERGELLRLENVWKTAMEGMEPFLTLLNAANKNEAEIHRAIVEVAFGMYFFAARTCDTVDSLCEGVRNSIEVAKQQLECSKADCEAANRQARNASILACIAIGIAFVSLLAGIWSTVYFGRCAHKDSEASTAAIVDAVKESKNQTR